MFQSTHPCGVRPSVIGHQKLTPSFNPRTRVGCDKPHRRPLAGSVFQSTHPCGVRLANLIMHQVGDVSIHAPVWGATQRPTPSPPNSWVSIHAPVWGATGSWGRNYTKDDVSIHAPVWGATPLAPLPNTIQMFQSTHPCGVRHSCQMYFLTTRCFNPRTRVGCDGSAFCSFGTFLNVSIHAPVWGATKRQRVA